MARVARELTGHTIGWVAPRCAGALSAYLIGSPGNPADTELMSDGTTGRGSVAYDYYIGTYEVTNAQYEEIRFRTA
jgi:hypothetical protein